MRIACVLDSDFEDSEFQEPYQAFKDAGHEVVVVGLKGGKELRGKPMELANKALGIDPNNRKALALAAKAAFDAKNYDQSIAYWEKILKSLPPDSGEAVELVKERIAEAKRLAKVVTSK